MLFQLEHLRIEHLIDLQTVFPISLHVKVRLGEYWDVGPKNLWRAAQGRPTKVLGHLLNSTTS